MSRLGRAFRGALVVFTWVAPSLAQQASAPASGGSSPPDAGSAVEAAAPKDVVRLKNGGMVRGTISELVPGETVTITTTTGKTREFPMAEVEYAGPASEAPTRPSSGLATKAEEQGEEGAGQAAQEEKASAKPYVTVRGKVARVSLISEPPGLVFHRQSGSATGTGGVAIGFDRLCAAPCSIELPAGTEQLSLSTDDDTPPPGESVDIPQGRSQILGTYESRLGLRVAGGVILGVSAIGGALLVSLGAAASVDGEVDVGMLVGGIAILVGGTTAGTIMVTRKDVTTFEVSSKNRHLTGNLPRPIGLSWSQSM